MKTLKIDGLAFFLDLKKLRIEKKLSLFDLSKQCKIRVDKLVDLENGDYQAMTLFVVCLYCKSLGIKKIIIDVEKIESLRYWKKNF